MEIKKFVKANTDESITVDIEIKNFTGEDFIQRKNLADLNEYGDFRADHLLISVDDETGFQAVGDLITRPRHLEEPVTLENVTLEVIINTRLLPTDHPARQGLVNLTADEIFHLPWERWACYDIPEDWEY